jgi:hypothetical protein
MSLDFLSRHRSKSVNNPILTEIPLWFPVTSVVNHFSLVHPMTAITRDHPI